MNEIPDGLTKVGNAAAKKILEVAKKYGDNSGGCKTFYSPGEWRDRGEQYGRDSELIIVHDGGDFSYYFNMDKCAYDLYENMCDELTTIGVYAEQCTSWYTAIYKI